MSGPQAIPGVPSSGPSTFEQRDVDELRRRLSDPPIDAERSLASADLDGGDIVAFFEITNEPSGDECRALYRIAAAALPPLRRPGRFNCEKVYPGLLGEIEMGYQL